MIEAIGVGIAGAGLFGFVGTLLNDRPDDAVLGISILLFVVGLFIANLGS
jgi:hypothetical protein